MKPPIPSINKIYTWLSERSPVESVIQHLKNKFVPVHKHSIWYYLGGLTLFFFMVQVVTGILLALYYKPTPDEAYESVIHIINNVKFGWLLRSMHSWAANLMIATLFLHLISVFFLQAYRKPRELMWLSGIILLTLILGFGFTGYLLPWDEIAYYATQIGTEIPKSIPIIGEYLVLLLRGGEEIGDATLTRMYTLHIVVLPLLTFVLIGIHIFLNQYYGVSTPLNVKEKGKPRSFYPNFLIRDIRAWSGAFLLLLGISMLFPWGLGEEADILKPAPEGIKPEWYFVPLYQTLKLLPSRIWLFDSDAVVNMVFLTGGLILILLPFIDRKSQKGENNIMVKFIGIVILFYLLIMTIIAYI